MLVIIFQQMMEVIREGYSEINVHSKESEFVGVDFFQSTLILFSITLILFKLGTTTIAYVRIE